MIDLKLAFLFFALGMCIYAFIYSIVSFYKLIKDDEK